MRLPALTPGGALSGAAASSGLLSLPLVSGALLAVAARVTGPYVAAWSAAKTAHLGEAV